MWGRVSDSRVVLFEPPTTHRKSTMNTAILTKTAIALGIVYAVYRFVPNTAVKAAAMGVVGTIVARQIPYVNEALS